jgi:hypothetical protein
MMVELHGSDRSENLSLKRFKLFVTSRIRLPHCRSRTCIGLLLPWCICRPAEYLPEYKTTKQAGAIRSSTDIFDTLVRFSLVFLSLSEQFKAVGRTFSFSIPVARGHRECNGPRYAVASPTVFDGLQIWDRTSPFGVPSVKQTPRSVISTFVQTTRMYLTDIMNTPFITGARPTLQMYCASWLFITGTGSLQR